MKLAIEKSQPILVTGARGLLGSALTKRLAQLGYTNVIAPGRAECDLLDAHQTVKIFREVNPRYVFHLAAKVYGIMGNMKNHAASYFENSTINMNVIEASRLVKVRKIVAMGTCAGYPATPPSFPLNEEDFLCGEPHDSEYGYAAAKRGMLAQLKAYKSSYGISYAYAIGTNLFGPNDTFDIENGHVIPSLIRKFFEADEKGEKIVVWGDGTAQRDFLYSEDAASALCLALTHIEGLVNIGSGKICTIKDIVSILSDYLKMTDNIEWDTTKPNGRHFNGMDVSKLFAAGFKVEKPLDKGLQATFEWYRQHHKMANSVAG